MQAEESTLLEKTHREYASIDEFPLDDVPHIPYKFTFNDDQVWFFLKIKMIIVFSKSIKL